ncbi:MFS transporter [Rhodohalobacter sulfatireducens]|uniref:MFS transporter n=1 Tax=Rhodohalobacter sulfatireducens TaxID=2911366 RepID=A0ABS9K865_9BACT|nr:MFS transporter [Rhodohalobacter sulfatireducens]MCG2587035.1 MFS transporter [Rhodohalobacter sulfatireducens]
MKLNISKNSLLKDLNLYIIFGVTLTSVMGVSSIAPAFPSIGRSLNVSTNQIGLLITFFTLPGIIFTPIFGILADRFNRKVILVPSLFLFGIAGTACALADSFEQLLMFRVFQGIGSAALGVLNLTLIGDLYLGNDRATVMGYNGSVLSIGTALYPAIGGALAIIGWSYPFYLSLLALPVGLFALFFLRQETEKNGLEIKFYLKEVKSALFSKTVMALFLCMFFTFIILYGGYITYFTILLDEKFAKSSFAIGAILSGSSLVTAITSAQLGRLTARFNEQTLIKAAAVLYTLIFAMIPFVDNLWFFAIPISLFGVAQGMNIPSIMNLLTGYAPKEFRAAFLSANWMVMRLGQAIGPYVLGLVYLYVSLEGTFYFAALTGILFIITSFTFLRGEIPSADAQSTIAS